MLVPIVIFGSITAIIIFIASRRHTERMELIAKGLNPYPMTKKPVNRNTKSLFFGLFGVGIGLALLFGAIFIHSGSNKDMITFGLIFLFGGGSMLTYYKLTAPDRQYIRHLYELEDSAYRTPADQTVDAQ